MNAAWHQENLKKFCKDKGIHVSAWSPLGANGALWGSLAVMDNPILKDIAIASGKTVAQVNFLTNQISLLFFDTIFSVA
jgi:diketogulonate reductase-like aldo/keto reductase